MNRSEIFVAALLYIVLATTAYTQRSNQGMGPLLDRAIVKPDDTIPDDLPIYDANGKKRPLTTIAEGKYTVLISGCLTCPIFHRSYPAVEAVYADYKENDRVQFFYMYKSLAHPELNGYIQPATLDERLAHIVEAKRVLGTTFDWLCDGTDNAVRHALGFGPNTQIIIDPSGKIVHALGWSDGDVLRDQLIGFVGDTPRHTAVSELNLKREAPYLQQRSYEGGVLEKPTFSSELAAVKITPINDSGKPLYVKPRIEADANVLQNGSGELYLGFFLDPLHKVHWNNLAAPLQYEFTLPDGTQLTPSKASAPTVSQESDGDPREFALSVESIGDSKTAELSIHYFACSKEEGWCIPVTQKYQVTFERDRDGGGTNGRSFRVANNRSQGPGGRNARGPGGNQASAEQMRQRILDMDSDGDGLLSQSEAPEGMRARFSDYDSNSDDKLDTEEINAMIQQRASRGGGGRGGPAGQANRGGQGGIEAIRQRVMESDANNDGLISREELPQQMQRRFDQMDADGSGAIDADELDEALRNRPGGNRNAAPRGRGQRPGGAI